MSPSMPVRIRKGVELLVERRDDVELHLQPFGAQPVRHGQRGEWSVSARYSWPMPLAAMAISRIEVPPSDQSECA